MRSLVGIITTIATVIHFTFGCCLHPCHGGGRGECVSHAIPAAACDECCHDDHDDHDHHEHEEAAGEADGVSCDVADFSLVATLIADGCHPCQGCHCAATSPEVVTYLKWSHHLKWSLVSDIVATIESEAIVLFAVVGGKHPPDPHLRPCPRGQALFERFLI